MTETLRALVVDEDDAAFNRAARVLEEVQIPVARAKALADACRMLREVEVVIVDDVDLPESAASEFLSLILTQPQNFVLMTKGPGAVNSLSRWADLVVNRLPKPFTSGDARGAFRRLLTGLGRTMPTPRPVVAARSGDWSDALRDVLTRAGAQLELVEPKHVINRVRAVHSPVAVLDAEQIDDKQLEDIAAAFKADPALAVEVIVATRGTDTARLLAHGASRAFQVPGHVGDLIAAVQRVLGLSRRTHPRAALDVEASLRAAGRRSLLARTLDVAETGLGVAQLDTPPYLESVNVTFPLPDGNGPIEATAEVVWTKEVADGHRAGMRFLGLGDEQRQRIYRYVSTKADAA